MSDWDKVVAATEGHELDSFSAHLDDGGKAWIYIRCTCQSGEPFAEQWEFTDHIRRIVFETLSTEAGGPAQSGSRGHGVRAAGLTQEKP